MHRRYAHFKSDFLDACSLHCLVSLIFMFITCLLPSVDLWWYHRVRLVFRKRFQQILFLFFQTADKTNNRLGVSEMLITRQSTD